MYLDGGLSLSKSCRLIPDRPYIWRKWDKCQSKWRGKNCKMDQCDIDIDVDRKRRRNNISTLTATKGRVLFNKSPRYRFIRMIRKTRRNSGTQEHLLTPAHVMEF